MLYNRKAFGVEKHLATYGLGEGTGTEKPELDLDPDEDDYLDWNGFIRT